ncbi:MAG: hypothetical protein WC974_08630 [Thermoplasmata archaeon]
MKKALRANENDRISKTTGMVETPIRLYKKIKKEKEKADLQPSSAGN